MSSIHLNQVECKTSFLTTAQYHSKKSKTHFTVPCNAIARTRKNCRTHRPVFAEARPTPPQLHHSTTAPNKTRKKKKNGDVSLAGNRTPASCELFFRVTSRNTDHYTTKDLDVFDEDAAIWTKYIHSAKF
jgi:hypothetical protein